MSIEAIVDALGALWDFGDPNGEGEGWKGLMVLGIWSAFLIALPAFLAKHWYGKREFLSASMGVTASLGVAFWIFGILPSAWLYFLDANGAILRGRTLPDSITFTVGDGYVIDFMSNAYGVTRDLVVVIETTVAIAFMLWLALVIQRDGVPFTKWVAQFKPGNDEKRQKLGYGLARTLVPGETKPEAGGYR